MSPNVTEDIKTSIRVLSVASKSFNTASFFFQSVDIILIPLNMLNYIDIHLIYTLPVIGILALITWPFINRDEMLKIILISIIAFVYTTPWENYVIYHKAWSYPPERLLAVIGYVPIEEYMFFIIQTVMTLLWAILCIRWSTPCLNFNYDRKSYLIIQWTPIVLLTLVTAISYRMMIPGQQTFYLSCVMFWVSPVLIFMWYGAGNFFVKKIISSSIAVVVPSLYLSWVDLKGLKDNIWHVNEKTSFNIFVVENLPLEEVIFYFVTNIIIVLAANCYDKSRGLIETYTLEFPLRFSVSLKFIGQIFRAFLTSEYTMSPNVTEDIKTSIRVLSVASKSFNTASFLFHSGIRLDLTILYAFCRVTDDMIDNEEDKDKKNHKLGIVEQFINELFADRKSDYDVKTKPCTVNIDWEKYQSVLTDNEISSFRAISRIAFYLPRKPFYELLAGYQWDVESRLVRDEDDLMLYSSYVAGSVGVLCVYVLIYRCDNDNFVISEEYSYVIEKAQQMGRVLQLVNIARDIITDSEMLGRCYVPAEYMDDKEEEIRIFCNERNPRSLGNKKLKKYSTRIIQLANKHQMDSVEAIRCLPRETRGSVLAATEIYRGLTTVIQSSPTYPSRASLSKWNKICIGLYSIYIKSIQYVL